MKNKMIQLLFTIAVGFYLFNCNIFKKKEDDNDLTILGLLALSQGCVLEGEITSDRTIGDCTLRGTVFVKNGATLTVLPGSTVRGEAKSSLFVLQGSKLIAEGSASSPIVFTSNKPVGERKMGDWGGIVIIGNSLIQNADSLPQTEGTDRQTYGNGDDPNDSSGILKYVRIEFAGSEVAPGDELNALSLYAVGKGTTVEYIQVHMGFDDGIEIFGGRLEPKYILATGIADDDVDVDEGYFGTIQYILGYKYPKNAGVSYTGDPSGFELDGANNYNATNQLQFATLSAKGASDMIIKNFTMIGSKDLSIKYGTVRDCAKVNFEDGQFVNFGSNSSIGKSSTGGDCDTVTDSIPIPPSSDDSIINCTDVTADVGSNISFSHNGSNCTINANSANFSSIVTTAYDYFNAPDTPPTFNDSNVKAFEGVGNWTTGWTNWRNN